MRGIFWLSLFFLGYTFAGYFLVMRVLSAIGGRGAKKAVPAEWPQISVVLVIHNEAGRVVERARNLLAADYPAEKIELIVVSDGSTDGGLERLDQLRDARIKKVEVAERTGKANGLNAGVERAAGEIIVFADCRQRFEANTIRELVVHFGDPGTGAVSGALLIDPAATAGGSGVDLYWRLERMVRAAEARVDSSIGCTGAVYAIRKGLFQPLPVDTILDDVVIPMKIALQGARVRYDEAAVAYDPQALEPARERIRKRRTLAGNFQMLFRHPAWLLPWRNRLWWQLISHKYTRLVAPVWLLAVFVSNAALVHEAWYRGLFLGQCVFYGLAVAGLAVPSLKSRVVSIPAGFCFLNFMVVAGFWHYVRMEEGGAWATEREVLTGNQNNMTKGAQRGENAKSTGKSGEGTAEGRREED